MTRLHFGTGSFVALGIMMGTTPSAWAQGAPLPALPSQAPRYAPPPPTSEPPPPDEALPPQYGQAPYGQQPYGQPPGAPPAPGSPGALPPDGSPYPPPPPRLVYVERETVPAKHAPKFALWTGARIGYLGFGGAFYGAMNKNGEYTETTGNLVTPGPSVQIDVGARLGRRYIPFVFYERDFLGAGRRFEGDSASVWSQFYGLGLRYTAGDVNTVGFLSDLSIGYRTVSITDNGSTFRMKALELFRVGLGAEIRLATQFTLSPLLSLSTGYMSDTSGSVRFSARGSADGATQPQYEGGSEIGNQRGYLTLGISCGAHFDLIGN